MHSCLINFLAGGATEKIKHADVMVCKWRKEWSFFKCTKPPQNRHPSQNTLAHCSKIPLFVRKIQLKNLTKLWILLNIIFEILYLLFNLYLFSPFLNFRLIFVIFSKCEWHLSGFSIVIQIYFAFRHSWRQNNCVLILSDKL